MSEGDPLDWSKIGSSGKPSHQFSCPICAGWTHTIAESAEGIVIVRPMTLHDHSWYRPVAEIFTRSALPWARMAVLLSYEAEFSDAEAACCGLQIRRDRSGTYAELNAAPGSARKASCRSGPIFDPDVSRIVVMLVAVVG